MIINDNIISSLGTSASMKSQERRVTAVHYKLGDQNSIQGKTILKADQRFHRVLYELHECNVEILTDDFGNNIVCEFVRLEVNRQKHFQLFLPDEYDVLVTQGSGCFFRSRFPERVHYWLPRQPVTRIHDKYGRIISEDNLPTIEIGVLPKNSFVLFEIPREDVFIDIVIWTLPANSSLFDEIFSLSHQEQQDIFLWGSHTQYTAPKDLYYNLIHGDVYRSDCRWPHRQWKSSYCETDAYALYVTLHSLWKNTGKKIYKLMKNQLVFSVIARQEDDGAWYHGSLASGDLDVDYRHYCSAIQMLLADYDETKNTVVGSSLKRAVNFLKDQYDELSVGNWYLHDSLEISIEAMRKSPVTYKYSRVLGKSPSNMLVLNTHLNTLVTLNRYQEVFRQKCLEDKISSGVNATIAVLELKPAEILYRLLFKAIELTFLPNSKAKTMSLPLRAIRRLARQKLIPFLPRIKKIFPRLVMPNGYIDRNLTLNEFWYPYFLINIMDLLRFQKCFNIKIVDSIIDNAVKFVQRVGLEKWLNDERAAYGVGFWAEALYIYCLNKPERSRADLAEVLMLLNASEQGIPPNLLGCNSEFIPLADQVPCFRTDNHNLLVINLSLNPQNLEFLIVNGTDLLQEALIPNKYEKLKIMDKDSNLVLTEQSIMIPARGWLRLVSNDI